jgi:hypothetical protein
LPRARRSLDRLVVRPRCAMAFVVLATALASGPLRADALGDLEKAHNAYVAHRYADAEARLRALLDEATGSLKDPDGIADARMYLGAVLVEEGKKEQANEVFERLLLDKSDYKYDPLNVSTDAINAFLDAQTRLRDTIRSRQDKKALEEQAKKAKAELDREKAALRLAMLEKMASEEQIIEKNSRWRALLPFGVGQFQNEQKDLGWVLLSAESLLAVGSVVGAVVSYYEQSQVNDSVRNGDLYAADYYRQNAYNAFVVGDLLAGAFFLTAIVGAVQAEVAFVPEIVHVRQRPIPVLALSPIAGPGGIGVSGRF